MGLRCWHVNSAAYARHGPAPCWACCADLVQSCEPICGGQSSAGHTTSKGYSVRHDTVHRTLTMGADSGEVRLVAAGLRFEPLAMMCFCTRC